MEMNHSVETEECGREQFTYCLITTIFGVKTGFISVQVTVFVNHGNPRTCICGLDIETGPSKHGIETKSQDKLFWSYNVCM